jgi:hypothetical protein
VHVPEGWEKVVLERKKNIGATGLNAKVYLRDVRQKDLIPTTKNRKIL